MARQIRAAVKLLEKNPRMARKGEVEGTREKLVSPFVIVYKVLDGDAGLEIVNVWHQKQGDRA